MKRINLYLPEPQLKKLKEMSKRQDMPYAELIRKAIDMYLGENKNKYYGEANNE